MQYLQNEIVYSSENGWTMTTCHNMEEFFKSTVEWKNVDTNEDILYEHNAIYKNSQAGKPTIMLKVGEWLEGCGDWKGK